MKKIITYTIIFTLCSLMMNCDEDTWLETRAIGAFDEGALANSDGVNKALISAYSELNPSGWNTAYKVGPLGCVVGTIHGGEAYKGTAPSGQAHLLEFSQFGVTTGNSDVLNNFTWGYNGIDRCNTTLKLMAKASDMTEAEKTQIEAEVRFLRGLYYFQTKRIFGNIPWVDETTEDVRVPNTDENEDYVNIWPQIAEDFNFARQNLPETQDDYGRPNSWAAACLYAKVLIYRACEGEYPNGFSEALTILTDAIDHGITMAGDPYDLLPDYHDNFDAAYENGPESVFAVQCSVHDGTPQSGFFSAYNALTAAQWWNSNNPSGPGLGTGWGNFQPTEWYANHFRTDANGLPYLDMFETNTDTLKDDFGIEAAPPAPNPDPFEIDTQGVDPRLDWSVGRRGIPFLGYGDFPGSTWIRDQSHGGPYFMKKFHAWYDQIGVYTSDQQYTAINIPILRFSDVLLLAAECEARVGDLDEARLYVNRVRQRMVDNSGSPRNWVKKDDGITDAANYRIGIYPDDGSDLDPFTSSESALEAILYERTLELGFEGDRFFDVVRFGKGVEEFNAFIAFSHDRYDYLTGSVYTDSPDKLLPIPRDAIDRSLKEGIPTLKQNPDY